MKVWFCAFSFILTTVLLPFLLGGCGGEEQKPVVVTAEKAKKPKLSEIYKGLRSDAEYGAGGWFKFSIGSENYATEYGYADFRMEVGDGNSRIILLSNPQSGGDFPMLRLILLGEFQDVPGYQGSTLEGQMLKLKFDRKDKFIQGTAKVTLDKADAEWLEGSFSGEIGEGDDKKSIEGSFKAKVNVPEEISAG